MRTRFLGGRAAHTDHAYLATACAPARAVVAAFVAACPADPLMATAHAICAFNAAGDAAARGEPGPGTFRVRFMDELHGMLSKGRGQGLAEFYGDRAAQVIGMVEWSGL